MKKTLLILSILFMGLLSPLFAQPPRPPGGGNGGGPPCFPPPCVPIDGGLSWLLLAGVAYGGKKYHEMNRRTKDEGLRMKDGK